MDSKPNVVEPLPETKLLTGGIPVLDCPSVSPVVEALGSSVTIISVEVAPRVSTGTVSVETAGVSLGTVSLGTVSVAEVILGSSVAIMSVVMSVVVTPCVSVGMTSVTTDELGGTHPNNS